MSIFRKKTVEPEPDYKQFVIDWLREQTDKDYDKVIKVVEIYREADEAAKVVELGSKKAVKEAQKEEQADAELDDMGMDFLGGEDGK
jgi:hypothetical protein